MYDLLNSPKPILYASSFRMQRKGYLLRGIRNRDELEDVYRLTYKCYVQKGYCKRNDSRMLIHYPHLDELSETAIFVVENEEGNLIGTVSTTRDNRYGLHVDEDFLQESDEVRKEGRSLASSWRIAVDQEYRSQSRVARLLVDGSVAYWHASNIETCLMTFNPAHEQFYARYLNCQTLSRKEGLHDLSNAPAVLMRWDASACPLKERFTQPNVRQEARQGVKYV